MSDHILRYFVFAHLRDERLKVVSAGFATLASEVANYLPPSAERTVALRKLLEAKDAAVRATLDAIDDIESQRRAAEAVPEPELPLEEAGIPQENDPGTPMAEPAPAEVDTSDV
jgi:hypothetical protein